MKWLQAFLSRSCRCAPPIGLALLIMIGQPAALLAQDASGIRIDGDGTVHTPELEIPPSAFLSDAGKAYLRDHLQASQDPEIRRPVAEQGNMPQYMLPYLERMYELYPVDRQESSIGGVPVYVYTPAAGIPPENMERVLINLHGGGFAMCFPGCAELESIPISSIGGFKVVSVDYRQGPQHRFPAASEDVAAVYRELLKTHRPQDIGIYGCSAGGLLTGMALAWFQAHDLPRPGAAGVFCSGLSPKDIVLGGDAQSIAYPLGEGRLAPPSPADGARLFPEDSYLADIDVDDPLASPRASLEVLSHFPDTLLITGTRGMEFSAAVYAHGQLIRAGVDARLHVWDGMFHGFFYNPDVPESREAYAVITRFFAEHLGSPHAEVQAALAVEAERARTAYEINNALPDTPGTGPFPAVKQIDPGLPQHVIYRPEKLEKGPRSLGLVLWGNGSCAADGASARLYLEEIASHGYLVIAPGTIRSGPGGTGPAESGLPADLVETTTEDLRVGLDWALAENRRPGSPYFDLIDEGQIAAMGYSCGGLQAVELAADPRIDTVILNNSGVFPDGASRIRNLQVDKSALEHLHSPVLYILGGPGDVAYRNGMSDFHDIDRVPAMVANIDTGHAGTFFDPNGGAAAQVAVAWLDWQLRRNPEAGRVFLGEDCTLCTDPDWTIERKWPE